MKRWYFPFVPVLVVVIVFAFTAVLTVSLAQAISSDEVRVTAVSQLNLPQVPENEMHSLMPASASPAEVASRSSQLVKVAASADQLATNAQSVDAVAAICLVTTTADSGVGSLRDCMANAAEGDVINFDTAVFPPNNPATISVSTPLPSITVNSLTIDGSDAGVIVNGTQLNAGSGFELTGVSNVIIRGLQILNFPWVGVDILVDTTNTIIGGDRNIGAGPLGQGNLISGNAWAGVWILGDQSAGNIVQGNYIGTNLAGNAAFGGQELGIIIAEGAHDNVITFNSNDAQRDQRAF